MTFTKVQKEVLNAFKNDVELTIMKFVNNYKGDAFIKLYNYFNGYNLAQDIGEEGFCEDNLFDFVCTVSEDTFKATRKIDIIIPTITIINGVIELSDSFEVCFIDGDDCGLYINWEDV